MCVHVWRESAAWASLSWSQISALSFIKPLDVHTMVQMSLSYAVITQDVFISSFSCLFQLLTREGTVLLFYKYGT